MVPETGYYIQKGRADERVKDCLTPASLKPAEDAEKRFGRISEPAKIRPDLHPVCDGRQERALSSDGSDERGDKKVWG